MGASTPYLSDLTRRFRAARAFHGIELKDAAAELGTSTDTLRRVEQGIKPIPPTYLSWAINEWKTPAWLLPGDGAGRDDSAGVARKLADLARQRQSEAESVPPEEGDVSGDSKQ
jgi:transcriptional regulator with XRE-family HTH domain